jgi:acyl dehydratase
MIDSKWIGHQFPTMSWTVEKGRLKTFAKAIGDERAVCHDDEAAKAAGYRSLLAPPTLINSGPLDNGDTMTILNTLGVNLANVLHGEQSFTYHKPVFAGDVLSFESRLTDIVVKKGGAMELVTQQLTVNNQLGECVAHVRNVIVVINK